MVKADSVAIVAGVIVVGLVVTLVLIMPLSAIPEDEKGASLTPVPLLMQKPEQMAARIVGAADDEIVRLRLNDTDTLGVIAYTTSKGDIILPANGLEDERSRIEYWFWSRFAAPLKDSDFAGGSEKIEKSNAMNFTRAFLQEIGYKLDGSEHFIAEPGGITVYQTVSGCEGSIETYGPVEYECIIANHPMRFNFKSDGGWIELRKWYEDVHQKEIKVTKDQAAVIARDFIESERKQDSEKFQPYGILTLNEGPEFTRKETYKDNLVHAVMVSYLTDKTPEEYHCAPYMNFDIFVDVDNGKAFGWRPSTCV